MVEASSYVSAPTITINVGAPSGTVELRRGDGAAPAVHHDAEAQGAPGSGSTEGASPWTTLDSFQNVTAEENENSFIKQFGRFTVHDSGASPGAGASGTTGKAYALTTKQGFVVGGNATHGSSLAIELNEYLSCNPPTHIFSTEKDFAALVTVGDENRLIVWGPNMSRATIRYPLGGIRAVYANRYAFAFIYDKPLASGQRIGAVGVTANGGEIPDDIQLKLAMDEPVSIRATEAAFAVLTRSGKVHAWGDANMGGSITAATAAVLEGARVGRIFASSYAFCAVGTDNQLIAWGDAALGGTIPPATLEALLDDGGVYTIVAAQSAFSCVTRDRRKALAWGSPAHGGSMSDAAAALGSRGGIIICKAAAWAFCIVNTQGQAEAWGHASHGGAFPAPTATGIQSIDETPSEGDDVRRDIEDILSPTRARSSSRERYLGATHVTSDWTACVYAVDSGFCLITAHPDRLIRSVMSWGAADTLVSDTTRQVLLGSYLQGVTTSNRAYLAVIRQGQTDGCVIAWGEATTNGGAIPDGVKSSGRAGVVEARAVNNVPTPVTTAASTNVSGFFVRRADGSTALWGGGTGTFYLSPEGTIPSGG